jgi:hypothetical protein
MPIIFILSPCIDLLIMLRLLKRKNLLEPAKLLKLEDHNLPAVCGCIDNYSIHLGSCSSHTQPADAPRLINKLVLYINTFDQYYFRVLFILPF